MWRFLSNYTTSYFTLVLCGVVYLCLFEGSLEGIYMFFLSIYTFWFWGWVWTSREKNYAMDTLLHLWDTINV